MRKNLSFIIAHIRSHPMLWMTGLFFPPLCTLAARLLLARMNQRVTDQLITVTSFHEILLSIISALLGVIVFEALSFGFNCVFSRFRNLSYKSLLSGIYQKVVKGKYDQISSFTSGDLITRYNKDTNASVDFLSGNIASLIYPAIIGIGYCIAIIATNLFVGLAAAFLVFLVTTLNIMFIRKFNKIEAENLKKRAKYTQLSDSALQGKITIRMLAMQDRFAQVLAGASDEIYETDLNQMRLTLLKAFTADTFSLLCTTLLFPIACLLVTINVLELSNAVFIANLCGTLMGFTSSFAVALINLGKNQVGVARVQQLLAISEEQQADDGLLRGEIPAQDPVIEIRGMTISLRQKEILNGASLSLRKGEMIALVGKSGCGKSTLGKAILGLLSYKGDILFHGVPASRIDLDTLREAIAYVPEKNDMIAGTMADNIRYGKTDADKTQLVRAMEQAALFEFLDGNEYVEKEIGEGGDRLSGGQRQRVCLARAFLKQADILILDEPTSALDTQSEQHILSQLRTFVSQGKSILCITHKAAVIKSADRVFEIDRRQVTHIRDVDRWISDHLCEEAT